MLGHTAIYFLHFPNQAHFATNPQLCVLLKIVSYPLLGSGGIKEILFTQNKSKPHQKLNQVSQSRQHSIRRAARNAYQYLRVKKGDSKPVPKHQAGSYLSGKFQRPFFQFVVKLSSTILIRSHINFIFQFCFYVGADS